MLKEVTALYDTNILDNFETVMSYMKLQKTCYDYRTKGVSANNSVCWYQSADEWNSSAHGEGYPANYDMIAIDISGTSWGTISNGFNAGIVLDTNGLKGPNQFGKDRFMIEMQGDTGSSSSGLPTKVRPVSNNNYYVCHLNECETKSNYFGTSWLTNQN